MHHTADRTWSASIKPSGAGPWGVTVRAMPTHPGLSSMYDTGLVASRLTPELDSIRSREPLSSVDCGACD